MSATPDTSVVPFGDHALLLTPTDPARTLAVANAAASALGGRAVSVVPGLDTVLVHLFSPDDLDAAVRAMSALTVTGDASAVPGRDVTLPVRYDGEDLANVAAVLGMSTDEVVARHCAPTYTVACLGFAPGFPYLTGLDPALTVARLDTPRTRVPAGAVGLAAGATCVYPSASPGGWRLIGSTDAVLFDADAPSPALLAAGDRVRFEVTR